MAQTSGNNQHPNPHTLEHGGDGVEKTVLIGNEEYKTQETQDGKAILSRYNSTYDMWIHLQFDSVGGGKPEDSLDTLLIKTLTSEYLKKILNGGIDDLLKQVLTKEIPGVTIPSTKKKEG